MATSKRAGRGRGAPDKPVAATGWRDLGQLDRFAALLNHYQTAEALSAATGIPARSLRAVFTTAVEGRYVEDEDGTHVRQVKRSKVIESPEWIEGFRRARHRMTDQMRRDVQKAIKGQYAAPIVRTPTNVIVPSQYRGQLILRDRSGQKRLVQTKSSWYEYNVEFLSDQQIWTIIEQLHGLFMDTGQFNFMRYEYLTNGEIYSGGEFKDRELDRASVEYELIKLSSSYFPFMEETNSRAYANWIQDDWAEKMLRGAARITGLYFMLNDERGQPWKDAQAAYKRQKRRQQKGLLNRGKRKRGI